MLEYIKLRNKYCFCFELGYLYFGVFFWVCYYWLLVGCGLFFLCLYGGVIRLIRLLLRLLLLLR